MINLKTKSDKHRADNEKRRQSIKEREKVKLNQSQLIKQALANVNINSPSSKKIVFDDDDDDDDDGTDTRNFDRKKSNGEGNCILFGASDSEEETPTIKEKIQFSGKKGFKLLNLQSTYGNDERFKIDERFLEDEKGDTDNDDDGSNAYKDETDPSREKNKMLDILGSVLGESVTVQDNTKVKKRQFDMIRYDASKKEHEIYEIRVEPETKSSSKKRKLNKMVERVGEEPPKSQVKHEGGQFSLLRTYGANDVKGEEKYETMEEDEVATEEDMNGEKETRESKQEGEGKGEKRVAVAQGIWKESFFFEKNDPRFKDSFEFINKKNSTEATEAGENYDQTRKKLKEILRLHMKKQLQKKDPFKNKIGGRNTKQLANYRQKNGVLSSKRKPPKMNSGKKV